MSTTALPSAERPHGLGKAFTASLVGTSLEWYDFAIYSVAAVTVFPLLFFPADGEWTGVLLALSTYAVGYLSRPIGGIVFGRLGDAKGRKSVLVTTLVLIGVTTALVGLMPSAASIGPWAGVGLVVLRFAQGVGIGGEWGGAVLLSSEFGSVERRGLWASAAQIGPPAGNLLANAVLAGLALALSPTAFLAWGWRVAFLLSLVVVGVGLVIRLRLADTPVFRAIEASGERSSAPIREVLGVHPRGLVAAVFSRVCPDVLYALLTNYVILYATTALGYSRADALIGVLIGSATQLVTIPFAGAMSDRLGRRRVYVVGVVIAVVWVPCLFLLARPDALWTVVVGIVVGLSAHSLMYGPQAALVIEQFGARLRYTGSSLAYTVAGILGGAPAPVLFAALAGPEHWWVPVAGYVGLTGVVTMIGLGLARSSAAARDEDVEAGVRLSPSAP